MLSILLQVVDAGIWQRIADQGLTLGLLAFVSSVLWKRLKEVEERQTKYMEEDRKAMIDVISKNTAAFEKVNEHLDNFPKSKNQ